MTWTNDSNLISRLMKAERELALANKALLELRGQVVFNLISPGNEHDTFEFVLDTISQLVGDGYEFDYDAEYAKEYEFD